MKQIGAESMSQINFKKEISGDLESVVTRVTDKLKDHGFGVLNRIDLHSKLKEKIGKEIAPTVILGACNPQLAFEAYSANPDVASLLPCNAVIREISDRKFSVELVKPSALMEMLGDDDLVNLSKKADEGLKIALTEI